ncbi:alpha/beta hydrolase [Oligosphaera ethanolica]|uniref:S-formylglutathione hydrolase FrmB n=1 Tax=Oligosphaera ethanolica TaxID=760260 RepID=A0AAE3VH31_9BACT|nr:alpha/beta hydrolase family protein [Oligosphaera ethanolica]MDQ0290452.1 S-formylglutathione hydrolase FrmB [Oligosphaera ethanolica]
MAFMECRFHSDVLGRAMAMNVIVPQQAKTQIGMSSAGSGRKDYPVLYLLHGMMGDYCSWMRQSSIERYAAAYDVVVVMPDGERGYYTDMVTGYRYWTMLSEELPEIVANLFPVSRRREDTYAAGLSMGGYGALKLALRRPDRYAGAVALSAVADVRMWFEQTPVRDEMQRIFGGADELIPGGNDLFALAENAVKAPAPPRLMMVCGTEDRFCQGNARFSKHLQALKWPDLHYREEPGGHEWGFWDRWIQPGLKFLLG